MPLKTIRLELARNAEFPEGSAARGYEFRAPLTADGTLDHENWRDLREKCTVRRFWNGEPDESGLLVHTRGQRWLFHYDHPGEDDDHDDPIFRFDRHHFVEGEYVSITEHDGELRTFRVVSVR
ncbi:MAG: hypothetical protein RLO51_20175 [Thalassobaculum sp.]|uniref:hypothetical protein n=1 Tax=Thalassobaculum sp. TaxID=2022740 RepID=UPI0032EE0BD5